MFASLLLPLAFAQGEPAAQVYADTQRRLAAISSLSVRIHPGEFSDTDHHDVQYAYLRPNMAAMGGWNVGWKTDGKRTVRNDSEDRYNRPAASDDLATAALLGFESFAPPLVRPVPTGIARSSTLNGISLLAIDLRVPGNADTVLFIDPRTRLPIGSGRHFEGVDHFETGYFVDTKVNLIPESFKVNWIRPASQVYGELRKWLAI
ncbi:hypothetical protein EON79_00970, partial [bacterium]